MNDPRLTPANARVAAIELNGQMGKVDYRKGEWKQCNAPISELRSKPDGTICSQILFGERFRVLEELAGWAFGQCERDNYVGYVKSSTLGDSAPRTNWVKSLVALKYPEIDIKSAPSGWFSFGSRMQVVNRVDNFCELAEGGFVPSMHLYNDSNRPSDHLTLASLFLGLPYYWGGNGSLGVDCSGLVQMASQAIGYNCPRDSDMQWQWMKTIDREEANAGDFVFWQGHVGILSENQNLIHSTAHHMQVVCEPLEWVEQRIGKNRDVEFLGFARLPQKQN